MSRKKAKEALAASSVKVAGRDVLATWKVLISLGLAPFLYGFYSFVATVIAFKIGAPTRWKIWTPFITMAAMPFFGFSALKFGEAGLDVLKSLRPLVIALLPGQQRSLNRLKAMRDQISNEVNGVINDFGPQLYEDFDQFRILVPSSSVPPSSGTPGIWRRKSGVGGVDAQGNLLVHPMTWIDERLFGWSRSARRHGGISGSTSRAGSVQPTPEGSDNEDEFGDYDNVVGYLHAYESDPLSRKRSRSNHASYADLQQLRRNESAADITPKSRDEGLVNPPVESSFKGRSRSRSEINLSQLAPVYHKLATSSGTRSPIGSPLSSTYSLIPSQTPDTSAPPSPSSETGPHLRRQRRSSLTDGVSVDRIGALSPIETFKDGTEGLNREINEARGVDSKED